MTAEPHSVTPAELIAQREDLRRRLLLKRLQIEQQWHSPADSDHQFPRSMTMRLITRRPLLARRLAMGLVNLFNFLRH